jgi:hypothetical protein
MIRNGGSVRISAPLAFPPDVAANLSRWFVTVPFEQAYEIVTGQITR